MAELFRIVYVSTARPGLDGRDLEQLLNVAQSNNDQRYITGYLVHNGASFMQLIEGPFAEIGEIYARILQDTRHSGLVRIQAEWVETRAFPDWSMNYFRVDRQGPVGAMIAGAGDPVDSLMEAVIPRDVLYLFSKFIQQADYAETGPGPQLESGGVHGETRSDQPRDPQA